jgi:hypothetical protein
MSGTAFNRGHSCYDVLGRNVGVTHVYQVLPDGLEKCNDFLLNEQVVVIDAAFCRKKTNN